MARPTLPLFGNLVGFFVFRDSMASPLAGKSVLCTGGSGSFGNAFIRRALADGARRVVCFSRDELKQAEMQKRLPDPRLRFFLGDIRDADRLTWAMRGVDTVVHAAAQKHVPSCEENPTEAIRTNVLGTLNVAEAAIRLGVRKAVFLSTDKAPSAHTLYGASKFCAERLWCQSNVYSIGDTRLSAVRYGNVLGSRGSVLDIWRGQAAKGEPVTLTDSKATRFWMRLEDAVDLVTLALSEMRGGEVFVGRVGSSPILTLAKAVAPFAEIRESGLRPAERLHETLISSDEARTTFDCVTHYRIEPESRTWGDVEPLDFPRVAPDFQYRSDTNEQQITIEEMRRLVA
jgi:UDP-N-acetylglucosamine 4,6-dehydratase